MIETPNTFWKPAANPSSHISGRTSADKSRPRCCTNLMISRVVTARSARAAWMSCMVPACWTLFVEVAGRLGLVVAERVELVGAMQEAFDRRARHHHIGGGQQHRLPHLMVPGPHPDRQPLVAVEGGVAENELLLLLEVDRAGTQSGLHDHLDGDPGRPVGPLHMAAAGALLEARIHLRGAVVLPGPMPGDRLEIDAADDRARTHGVIGHLPHEIEGFVG